MEAGGSPMVVEVRPLHEDELGEADRIHRRAYGSYFRLADPLSFGGDAQVLKSRWTTDPAAAFALVEDGHLAGSCFVTRWGSVGLLGPVSIDPDRQGRGLAHPLLEEALRFLDGPPISFHGLFTFAESAKHVGLCQRYGYWPASLAAVMSKKVSPGSVTPEGAAALSRLTPDAQAEALSACRELTDSIFDGLDVTGEVLSLGEQGLGDVVLSREGSRVAGVAVCHAGPGSEAGTGRAAVKFAAVRSGAGAGADLRRLLEAVEAWAASEGASVVTAGTGSGRIAAWTTLREVGYRPFAQGVAMHRDRHPGYDREDVFVLDDWR
jgi:GNAT superfamily N-acetyltransferase